MYYNVSVCVWEGGGQILFLRSYLYKISNYLKAIYQSGWPCGPRRKQWTVLEQPGALGPPYMWAKDGDDGKELGSSLKEGNMLIVSDGVGNFEVGDSGE